jgi:hypothetical protein
MPDNPVFKVSVIDYGEMGVFGIIEQANHPGD